MITPSQRTTNFHYAIRNLARAAALHESAGREIIYLNIGDPQTFGFRPPAHITEAVARAMRDGFTGYAPSSGLPEAREAIAAYASAMGAPTTANDVVITSGASEAADLVLTALVNEGDEVLLPAPGYPLYGAILGKLGAKARHYKLDEARGWQPSIEEVRSLVTPRTRALLLINPSNPTGAVMPDATTGEMLELAAEHNLLVISDEVYRELCFGEQPAPASLLAQDLGVPLITLESLSKTHMIPGWRVGWMRFTHGAQMTELITAIHRLADGRLCSPTPTQYAVRPALEGSQNYMREFMREIKRRRDLAIAHVQSIEGLSCAEPEAAFYLMVKAAARFINNHPASDAPHLASDERFVHDMLAATGVLVVHGSGFGADADQNYFRLVYLADEATLDTAFDRIKEFLATR